jgi:nucleoside-diphosphate-sugar epimerase
LVEKLIGIIGHRGFIGSAMVRASNRAGFECVGIGRTEKVTEDCDFVIDCNGNSRKFEVNQNPDHGIKSIVEAVENRVQQLHGQQSYIYISSGEVYGLQQKLSTEIDRICPGELSYYGTLKLRAEEIIQEGKEDFLIVRPSGFVGSGLVKNPIFDLINGHQLFAHPDSLFQFCDVDWFADTVVRLATMRKTGIWNVSSTGTVSIREVSEFANIYIDKITPKASIEHHELSTKKLQELIDIPGTKEVVKKFLGSVLK